MIYLQGPTRRLAPSLQPPGPRSAGLLPPWLLLLCPLCGSPPLLDSECPGPRALPLDLTLLASSPQVIPARQALTTRRTPTSFLPPNASLICPPEYSSGHLKIKIYFTPFSPANVQTKKTKISAPLFIFPISINSTSIFLNAQVENLGSSLLSSFSNTWLIIKSRKCHLPHLRQRPSHRPPSSDVAASTRAPGPGHQVAPPAPPSLGCPETREGFGVVIILLVAFSTWGPVP